MPAFENEWLIGIVSVLILYFVYWYRRPKRFPPGPRGIPLLGYFPVFREPHKKMNELSKKLGPVFSLRMGADEAVVLNNFEWINQAFVKQGAVFSGRARFATLESIRQGHGIIFIDAGPFWKSQRKFGLITLRGLGSGSKRTESICSEELQYLLQEIEKTDAKPFNMTVALHNAVSNVTCKIILGNRFDYDDEHFIKMLYVVIHLFEDPFLSMCHKFVILSPWLKHLPPISFGIGKIVSTTQNLLGSEGTVSYSKKSEMPYTNAFTQEVFRTCTLSPIGMPHRTMEDVNLGSYFIPKHTKVFANVWAVHNDPKLWKDPQKFMPERFLDEQGNFINSKHVIPFSVGPRHCLGEQLARMELFIFLVGIVQKYEMFPDPNSHLPAFNEGSLGIVYAPKSYKLVAKPR